MPLRAFRRPAAALLAAAALALSAPSAGLRAQAPSAAASAPAAAPAQAPAAAPAAGPTAGLPSRAAPARTLRAHWHVFAAFAIGWALVFGYLLSVLGRWRRLERDLDALRGEPAAS